MQRKGMLDWLLEHCLVSAIAAISNAKEGGAGLAIGALFGKLSVWLPFPPSICLSVSHQLPIHPSVDFLIYCCGCLDVKTQ